MTSEEFNFRLTRIAKHSRLCSSRMLSVLNDETLSANGPRTMVECRRKFGDAHSRTIRHGRDTQDAGSIIEPKPPLLKLLHWHFKPLTSPQTLDTFVIHLPASVCQQGSDPVIAIWTVLPCQLEHVRDQAIFVRTTNRHTPLRGTVLAKDTANSTFIWL